MSTKPVKRRAGSPARGAGRGGPKRGYSWPPFEPGHELSIRHGAYATLHLRPRAEEIAVRLREALGDSFEDKFTPAIEAAALAAARVERALGHILDLDEATIEEQLARLDDRARGWLRLYLATLERLGLTPKVGTDGGTGPVTLVIATAFPGVRRAGDVIELEAEELPAIEAGGDAA